MNYSLILIFLLVPLYFSHVFTPFGIPGSSIDSIVYPLQIFISDHSSFERQKVFLFLLLIIIAVVEGFLFHTKSLIESIKKYGYIFLILASIPLVSIWISGDTLGTNFYSGGYEKHHGYIFFIGILIYILLLMSHSLQHLKQYVFYSFLSAIIVAGIAIGENLGGIWDIYERSQMISSYVGRSSSTLGNPNYLAGFLLIYLPIIYFYLRKYRSISWLIFLVGIGFIYAIYTTGSYIALFVAVLLFIWYQIRFLLHDWALGSQLCIHMVIIVITLYIGSEFIDEEKLLSLQSRFILMKEVVKGLSNNIYALFFGFGPDSVLSFFSQNRSHIVNAYFPQNMLIDSSHNIFMDIWFQYGIIPMIYIIVGLWKMRQELLSSMGIAYVSGIVFLSLNVFVLIHILIVSLLGILLFKEYQIKKSK